MTTTPLELTREQIVSYRQSVNALGERLPPGPTSLRRAAWAGLTDSMPRAAVLSIHARVQGTGPDTWEDEALVQVWGPRFSAYVVPARDVAVFTLGRLPYDAARRKSFEDLAARLDAFLDGRTMTYGEAGREMGVHHNQLRHAAPTGRVLIRWEGARQPTIWTVPPPDVDPGDARLELARRYLHVFGPGTAAGFGQWAGIRPAYVRATFDALVGSLTPVRTPVGDAWILPRDEPTFRARGGPAASARLLPSGDAYFLLQGADRELLLPDARRRGELWTPRVWPGAVLVEGDIVGPGDAPRRTSRSPHGDGFRARSARRWRRRLRPCRCPASSSPSGSVGATKHGIWGQNGGDTGQRPWGVQSDASTMPTDLEPVYRRLKSILEPYGRRLHVTDEGSTTYAVDVAPDGERNPTTWFGGVRLGKRYVSYYLMPVYVDPSLAETISPELKRHMQGKSCFNFTKIDERLFAQLDSLTKEGYERTAGDSTWGATKRVEHGMAHRRAGSS